MKRKIYAAFMLCVMALQITAPVFASSHREAPLIADDPLADNTDVYAFRSPEDPNKVTIIANYIPLQGPAAGPNFFEFGEDVRLLDARAGTELEEANKCNIVISLFENILALPPPEAAALLRAMSNEKG